MKWISVNDRLPEKWQSIEVIVNDVDYGVICGIWEDTEFCAPSLTTILDVTHWMPLPDQPLEKTDDMH